MNNLHGPYLYNESYLLQTKKKHIDQLWARFSQDVTRLSRRVFLTVAHVKSCTNGYSGCSNVVAPLVVGVLRMRAAVTI